MGAAFDDAAGGEDADEISVFFDIVETRCETISVVRFSRTSLRLRRIVSSVYVSTAEKRAVEDQYPRVTDQPQPGRSRFAVLSARECDSVFADDLLVFVWKLGNVVRETGNFGRCLTRCPGPMPGRRSCPLDFGLWTVSDPQPQMRCYSPACR